MTPRTLGEALAEASDGDGGFWHLDERGTGPFVPHASLAERAAAVAGGLAGCGAVPGATVAIAAAASDEFAPAFFGAVLAGCAVTPLPASSVVRDADGFGRHLAALLDAARPDLLVADSRTRAVLDAGYTGSWRGHVLASDALPAGPARHVARTLDDTLLVQLTSGSTGRPRRVILTHRMVDANVRAIAEALAIDGRRDVGVSWLPLHHDMGLVGTFIGTVMYGARSALLPPLAFVKRPALWLRAIAGFGGTISFAPSSAYALAARRLRARDVEGLDLSRWRVAGCGAEPVDAAALDAFARVAAPAGFDRRALTPCYGLAEHVVAATVTRPGTGVRIDVADRDAIGAAREDTGPPRRLVSCGRPLAGHAVRIVDPDGAALGERQVGEIELSGPSVMRGYLEDDGTVSAPACGRLRTGDLGYLVDGELFVCGRLKETIIRHGEKLHPEEVESAAAALDGLGGADIVAFGVAGDDGEDRLLVAIEVRTPGVGLADRVRGAVLERCNVRVDEILFLRPHAIPHTTSGKPRRLAVRDAYRLGTLATVSDGEA